LNKQTEKENHDTLLINCSRKTTLPSSLSYYISVLLSLLQLTALHWLVQAIKGHYSKNYACKNDILSSHISSLPVIRQQFSSTYIWKDYIYFLANCCYRDFPRVRKAKQGCSRPVPFPVTGLRSQRAGDSFAGGERGREAPRPLFHGSAGFPFNGPERQITEICIC